MTLSLQLPRPRQNLAGGACSLRARLRAHTAVAHAALEARLDLERVATELPRYIELLRRFLGFYHPLEDRLARSAVHPLIERAALIERDLRALGAAPRSDGPVCRALPILDTPARAFGCMYVIEGASLGGQVIERRVSAALGLSAQRGAAFFHGLGPGTGRRWTQFLAALAAFGDARPELDNDVLGAAAETFHALGAWLDDGDRG